MRIAMEMAGGRKWTNQALIHWIILVANPRFELGTNGL